MQVHLVVILEYLIPQNIMPKKQIKDGMESQARQLVAIPVVAFGVKEEA